MKMILWFYKVRLEYRKNSIGEHSTNNSGFNIHANMQLLDSDWSTNILTGSHFLGPSMLPDAISANPVEHKTSKTVSLQKNIKYTTINYLKEASVCDSWYSNEQLTINKIH